MTCQSVMIQDLAPIDDIASDAVLIVQPDGTVAPRVISGDDLTEWTRGKFSASGGITYDPMTGVFNGGGAGASTFIGLSDTPANYTGAANQIVRVNAAADGLEYLAVIPETNGGTGQSTYTTGDLLISDGADSLAKLAIGSSGTSLKSNGTTATWETPVFTDLGDAPGTFTGGALDILRVNAAADALEYVSVIPETSGGTGLASYTTGDLLYADGADSLTVLPAGSDDQVLTLSGGVPTWADAGGGGGGGTGWPQRAAGRYYNNLRGYEGADAGANGGTLANYIQYYPVQIGNAISIDNVYLYVKSAVGGSTIRVGLYGEGSNGKPGSLIVDAGTVSSATTGLKTWNFTAEDIPANSTLWIAVASTSSVQLNGADNVNLGNVGTYQAGRTVSNDQSTALYEAYGGAGLPASANTTTEAGPKTVIGFKVSAIPS